MSVWFFPNFIYLFLAVLSSLLLRLFFSCGEQKLLSSCGVQASHWGIFSCCRAWALGCEGFSGCASWALEYRINSCGECGLVAPQHVGSSWIKLNLCLLYWQEDYLPLSHQGSSAQHFLNEILIWVYLTWYIHLKKSKYSKKIFDQ